MIEGITSIDAALSSTRRDFADIGILKPLAPAAAKKKPGAATPFYRSPIFLVGIIGAAIFFGPKLYRKIKGGRGSSRPFGRRRAS